MRAMLSVGRLVGSVSAAVSSDRLSMSAVHIVTLAGLDLHGLV
jgi:hypothetical protein